MPKNKDPAVLFYTSDFLVGVSGLTMQERGQYITLLCLQHQSGHLTEKEIELAVGKPSADVMKKFIRDDDGRYYQHRMEIESIKRANYTSSQSEKGKKSAEKRASKSTAVATAVPTELGTFESRLIYRLGDLAVGRTENSPYPARLEAVLEVLFKKLIGRGDCHGAELM